MTALERLPPLSSGLLGKGKNRFIFLLFRDEKFRAGNRQGAGDGIVRLWDREPQSTPPRPKKGTQGDRQEPGLLPGNSTEEETSARSLPPCAPSYSGVVAGVVNIKKILYFLCEYKPVRFNLGSALYTRKKSLPSHFVSRTPIEFAGF